MTSLFYFDIETVANPKAVELLGPVKPDSRLKDPLKIALSVQEKTLARTERGALDCDTSHIVAIGWEPPRSKPMVAVGGNERVLVEGFWAAYASAKQDDPDLRLCGFNCVAFDLPGLIRASQRHNLWYPEIALSKYRHPDVLDLMMHLTWDGLVDPKSLSVYCRLFNVNVPEDETTGADIGGLVAAGNWEAVRLHCECDVVRTRMLAERLGL